LQSFINQCLRYICRIWWPRVISKENLWKETNKENVNIEVRRRKFSWIGYTLGKSDQEPCSSNVEPTRFQKERKAKEQLAGKHINRSWEKELGEVEICCQR
jgi:hypothetical protein